MRPLSCGGIPDVELRADERRIVDRPRQREHDGVAHHELEPLLRRGLADDEPAACERLVDDARGRRQEHQEAHEDTQAPRRPRRHATHAPFVLAATPDVLHAAEPLPDGFTLLPQVFDAATSAPHLRALAAELRWEQQQFTIYGRKTPMPRLIAMYGPVGYRYSGVVHPPCPLPPRLDAIRRRVEEVTGRSFNSVLANLYRDGNDSVGWHRDSDYAHGGQPDIASVSFGATRRFEVRDGTGRARAAVDLEDGSLLVMTGDAVARWWHRVAKTRQMVGPRVNLTFWHMVADA